MQTNPAAEQNETLNGPRVCGISPVQCCVSVWDWRWIHDH